MKKTIAALLVFLTVLFAGCRTGSENIGTVTPSNESITATITESEIESAAEFATESVIETLPQPQLPEVNNDFTVTLSFLGDMLLACQLDETNAGSFNEYTNNHSADYFLEKVRPFLQSDDFTVANLETVLTDRPLEPIVKDYSPAYWFKSKSSNINILSGSSIDAVLVNNNHTGDYGIEGYNDTINSVVSAGMQYGDDSNIIYYEKNGFKIAVICIRLWGDYSTNPIIRRLKEAEKKSDYQIIMFHGGTEKTHAPEDWKVNAAHTFVDNGADLVIGGHPHVLQPKETYNGVEIIYSLGNFCYGGHRRPENRTIIYQATITVDGNDNTVKAFSSDMIPCYVYTGNINNYQPAPIEDQTIKQQVIDFMEGKINSPI